jgi:hypothetical protein
VQLCQAKTIFLSQTGIFWHFFIQLSCAHNEHLWRCSYLLLSGRANCAITLSQNHFPEPNQHIILTFLHSIVMCTYWAPLEMLLSTYLYRWYLSTYRRCYEL